MFSPVGGIIDTASDNGLDQVLRVLPVDRHGLLVSLVGEGVGVGHAVIDDKEGLVDKAKEKRKGRGEGEQGVCTLADGSIKRFITQSHLLAGMDIKG